jgi:hypothetical protein
MTPATKPCEMRLGPPTWIRWAGFILLATYLLFNHGCHGNEDNELFAVIRAAVK